jgi:hypothetical protein
MISMVKEKRCTKKRVKQLRLNKPGSHRLLPLNVAAVAARHHKRKRCSIGGLRIRISPAYIG